MSFDFACWYIDRYYYLIFISIQIFITNRCECYEFVLSVVTEGRDAERVVSPIDTTYLRAQGKSHVGYPQRSEDGARTDRM